MLSTRLKAIKKVVSEFKGVNNEPSNVVENYILKSMWVMLMSEFEASIKDIVESYIDEIKKKKKISEIHICLLLQNFYGNKEDESLTVQKVLDLHNRKKKDIEYRNFTKNKKVKYKYDHIKTLFNSLGIFFKNEEDLKIRLLDGIASTRDSIAHGDHGISITSKQLSEDIITVTTVYKILKKKLKT